MADNDRTRGYRDNEAFRRPRPSSDQPAGDPLAELARLIGQQNESDPFQQQSRAPALHVGRPVADQDFAAPDPYERQPNQRAPQWPSFAADQGATAVVYGDSRYDPRRAAGGPQAHPSADAYPAAEAYPSDQGYPSDQPFPPDVDPAPYDDPSQATPYSGGQYDDPRYGDQRYAADPRYADAGYDDPRYAAPGYGDQSYGAEQGYSGHGYGDARYADGAGQGYADPRYPDPNFDAQGYAPSYPPAPDGYPAFGSDQRYQAFADQGGGLPQGQPYANAQFGAPPPPAAMAEAVRGHMRAKRHGGMVTVLAVLALAVVGTAAAFGYRAVFSGAGSVIPPPVIKADVRPSKVVPATDPNNKPIQDRIGVKTEKIVPRQEEPVQQAAPGQPRVISPWLGGQNPQAFPPASANVAPTGSAAPSGAEPKRIRTVPIKPQQGTEAPAQRNTRSASPAAPPDAADQAHAPMALAPTGSVSPQRPAAREAHAALTPRDTGTGGGSPFPTPLPGSPASAPASGPFAVQVTSQRSEADAQASFRSLQQQFPSVLGNRQPLIRRADLGERGTYYRAQIPFSSQSAANEFCSSLKAAGGQCVVARN